MKERPIIFSGLMVLQILAGYKTITRRLVRPQPSKGPEPGMWHASTVLPIESSDIWLMRDDKSPSLISAIRCPYGKEGDLLWVKEAFYESTSDDSAIRYKANCSDLEQAGIRWISPLFMPRQASRITLKIARIRAERLQDITEEDANQEGFPSQLSCTSFNPARMNFAIYWDQLHQKPGTRWADNPWVWRVQFEKVKP